jgi:hypothetical protein
MKPAANIIVISARRSAAVMWFGEIGFGPDKSVLFRWLLVAEI